MMNQKISDTIKGRINDTLKDSQSNKKKGRISQRQGGDLRNYSLKARSLSTFDLKVIVAELSIKYKEFAHLLTVSGTEIVAKLATLADQDSRVADKLNAKYADKLSANRKFTSYTIKDMSKRRGSAPSSSQEHAINEKSDQESDEEWSNIAGSADLVRETMSRSADNLEAGLKRIDASLRTARALTDKAQQWRR